MNQCSSLNKLKKTVAGQLLNSKSKDDPSIESEITVELLQQEEQEVVKHVQRSSMSEEYEALKRKKPVRKSSHIYKLSPILSDDIICIGGRLNNSDMPAITKHQMPTMRPTMKDMSALNMYLPGYARSILSSEQDLP